MTKTKKFIALALLMLPGVTLGDNVVKDNEFSPLITGVNSLIIAPDARGASMGDIGAATSPDVNSQFWNPAKFAFADSKAAAAANYTPWMRKVVNDVFLTTIAGYFKPGHDNNQALSATFRYFSLGDVLTTGIGGEPGQNLTPYELSFDAGYSRKLSNSYSMGIVLRYIYSDLGFSSLNFGNQSTGASAFSADISGFFTCYPVVNRNECRWSVGWNISNIGTKINYNNGDDPRFLPTNLRVGTTFVYPVAEHHNFALSLDLNKLLVPAYPRESNYDTSTTDGEKRYLEAVARWEDMSSIKGIFKSFSDGSFKEEMQEICWSLGGEYCYNNRFSLRVGYFHESSYKGNRQYVGIGTGFALKSVSLDVSYMIATSGKTPSPLDGTLRFSLAFDIEGLRNIFGK